MSKSSKIYVAGHRGMVGSALLRLLKKRGYQNLIYASKRELDLRDQAKVLAFFKRHKPHAVFIAAAKVGGILANNTHRAEFLYDNLVIQNNLIHTSYLSGIKNLIFLGSSCIYPKLARQPIKEDYLLSDYLEPTNEPYAIAKIAGLKMCEAYNFQYKTNYKCLMPCNLFGPGDNYDEYNSHFFPALIKKIHFATENNLSHIHLWGDGSPKRELMYVDDLANAAIYFLKKKTKHTLINIGSGIELTIENYAKFIMQEIGIKLNIKFDKNKPNGTPRKIINCSIANSYGWRAKFSLKQGFQETYNDYLKNYI
ncbi:MAG: GDP-L-fucose synthase family protein [Alphaproteobacteria bacterium]